MGRWPFRSFCSCWRSICGCAVFVVDRTLECAAPGGAPFIRAESVRQVVVHHCSLSHLATGNPHPVPDKDLDGPALAGRFRDLGLGTGGRVPYHVLITIKPAVEQMLPLRYAGAHAVGYNRVSWAVAVVGEDMPCTFDQLGLTAQVCARLVSMAGLGSDAVVGHTDLPGASRDPRKRCPRPTIDIAQLRALVRDYLPSGYLLLGDVEREAWARGSGLVV
jgi:hypothetical protein